ncbi:hypothetical protein BHM03_00032103 [Ensete ventricosum]|nr:hypothetical protein BHM03_00032103 [Ensete ventricosum]
MMKAMKKKRKKRISNSARRTKANTELTALVSNDSRRTGGLPRRCIADLLDLLWSEDGRPNAQPPLEGSTLANLSEET